MAKKLAMVDKSCCVACGACGAECPKNAITIWKGCYAKIDAAICVGCGKCGRTCPAGCIEVKEREAAV